MFHIFNYLIMLITYWIHSLIIMTLTLTFKSKLFRLEIKLFSIIGMFDNK